MLQNNVGPNAPQPSVVGTPPPKHPQTQSPLPAELEERTVEPDCSPHLARCEQRTLVCLPSYPQP